MISIAAALLKRFWPFILAVILTFAVLVWWNRFIASVEQRGYDKAVGEYAVKRAESIAEAATETAAKIAAKDAAIEEGVEREKELRRLMAVGAAANAGMRHTINNLRSGLLGQSNQTCANTGNALAAVLEECVGRYLAVAEVADRHASDAKTLSEAWPKKWQ